MKKTLKHFKTLQKHNRTKQRFNTVNFAQTGKTIWQQQQQKQFKEGCIGAGAALKTHFEEREKKEKNILMR